MERTEFDRLLSASLPRVERIAQAYAAQYNLRHEWRDLSQTAILKMLRFADYYDPERGEFMPWACVVIINTVKTRVAQIINTPNVSEFNSVLLNRTQTPDNPETNLQTSIIFDSLNEESRLYFEGYNYKEIAARVGVRSKATVMARIDLCAARLSRLLGVKYERGLRIKTFAKLPERKLEMS